MLKELFIKPISDIHLETRNGWYNIPESDSDANTILVLAGDIYCKTKLTEIHKEKNESYFEHLSKRFKYVVMVLGNHDYWNSSIEITADLLKEAVNEAGFENIFILQNEKVILDNVAFIGGTLWTDYNKNPVNGILAEGAMNDFKKIRKNLYTRKLTYNDLVLENRKTIEAFTHLLEESRDMKTVVISHHGPTTESRDKRFAEDFLMTSYVSNFSDLILEYQPDFWIHGHVHCKKSYMVGDTLVVANPVGYPSEIIDDSFNHNLKYKI